MTKIKPQGGGDGRASLKIFYGNIYMIKIKISPSSFVKLHQTTGYQMYYYPYKANASLEKGGEFPYVLLHPWTYS